jgi:ribose transport system ATP-binding protein
MAEVTGGPEEGSPLLELRGVCKRFGATRALHNVDLRLRAGEVHALIGENGAGKSTLMRILSGACRADEGQILLDGQPRVIDSPTAGFRNGVAMIYQELTLAPHLSVEQNLDLGSERSAWGLVRHRRERIAETLALLGHPDLPLGAPVRSLPIGLQQMTEIARALLREARILIMDEPTSSLSAADARALFDAIRRLRDRGIGIIYISHFLEEVFGVADTYTVLRDGETVGTGRMADTDLPSVIGMMVGRALTEMFPKTPHKIGGPLLEVGGLEGSPVPRGVSFTLRRGEILGVAGLVGAGRSETLRGVFGLRRATGGTLTSGDCAVPAAAMTPRRAHGLKIDFLSEDRKEEGLATAMSVSANMTLSSLRRYRRRGLLSLRRERAGAAGWIRALNVRCQGPDQPVHDLSGGNQQKVALARILEQGADVILLDEPTRGIDVGSKAEIYQLVGKLAAEGKGVVFVSSYLPELMGVCDTVCVMRRGRMTDVRPVEAWTEREIMRAAVAGGEGDNAG